MKNFTSDEIQARFENLPKELQEAVNSAAVTESIEAIGKKNGLLIDQIGELVDMVGLIMLGLMPSNKFVVTFSKNTGVKADIAESIAEEINQEIFGKLRTSIRTVEEQEKTQETGDLQALEQAGGFSVEKTAVPDSETATEPVDVTSADKARILNDVEFPGKPHEKVVNNDVQEIHTEPLVDHLLTQATANGGQQPVSIAPSPTATSAKAMPPPTLPTGEQDIPTKPKGPDPYRESFK
jgi:hypothetical protein